MSPFRCYEIFSCMKRHWNTNYDYVKYKGKASNLNQLTYEKCKEKWFYEALHNKYRTEEQLVLFLIPVFFNNQNTSFGDFFSEETKTLADSWFNKIRAIKRTFIQDSTSILDSLLRNKISFEYFFSSDHVLDFLIQGKISPETFIILDKILFFLDKTPKSNIIYNVIHERRIKKYTSFISVDIAEYKKVFESCIVDVKKQLYIESTLTVAKEVLQCEHELHDLG